MLNILFLFMFDRATATPAGVATCAEIIDAGDRFQRRPPRDQGSAIEGSILPFVRREAFRLYPYLQPLHLTVDQFLDDPNLRSRLYGLREYMRVVKAQQPRGALDLLEIRVQPDELNSLLTRGTLPEYEHRVRKVNPTKLLKPNPDEISLVFNGRARHLLRNLGEFPIWDLHAIVTGAQVHDETMRVLKLRHGYAPYGMVKPIAWSATEERHVVDIPMVFEVDLNPFDVFALARNPSADEAYKTDFLAQLENRAAHEPFGFWMPYARSIFEIESLNGKRYQGRFVETIPDDRGKIVLLIGDEYEEISFDMIRQIALRHYVPNAPDGKRIVIDPWFENPEDVIMRLLDNAPAPDGTPVLAPVGTIVISNPGLNLDP